MAGKKLRAKNLRQCRQDQLRKPTPSPSASFPSERLDTERYGEEQLYEREEIFGRDASSVFPTEGQAVQPAMDVEATKAAIGALKFISESQLKELAAQRGPRVEDGAVEPAKPLAEVLKENKEKKEEHFQAVWRSMKTGKNRPLDEDELAFVTAVAEAERKANAGVAEEEAAAVRAFQQAVHEAAEGVGKGSVPEQAQPRQKPRLTAPATKKAIPVLTVLPRKRAAASVPSFAVDKRQRGDGTQDVVLGAGGNDETGLTGLLGSYGSDNEDST